MAGTLLPVAESWFAVQDMGGGLTRIREQWLDPAVAANLWLIRGQERDLLFDSGTGLVSLKKSLPQLFIRPVVLVSSHSHFDHIGGSFEFVERWMHPAEAGIISRPNRQNTTVDDFMDWSLFQARPFAGFEPEGYRVKPAPPSGLVEDGRVIDLGYRRLQVLHLPGHSPGSIGLFENETGTLFSGDALFDGHLYDDVYHSDIPTWLKTMDRLLALDPAVIHGGHFESFGRERAGELIRAYIKSKTGEGGKWRSQTPPQG